MRVRASTRAHLVRDALRYRLLSFEVFEHNIQRFADRKVEELRASFNDLPTVYQAESASYAPQDTYLDKAGIIKPTHSRSSTFIGVARHRYSVGLKVPWLEILDGWKLACLCIADCDNLDAICAVCCAVQLAHCRSIYPTLFSVTTPPSTSLFDLLTRSDT